MSDLLDVLPQFDVKPYRHLLHSLEKNDITVAELITLDPIDVAKRCPLPLNDLKLFTTAIVRAIQRNLAHKLDPGLADGDKSRDPSDTDAVSGGHGTWPERYEVVKTMDAAIDSCLNGGFRTGHVSEIVGESAVGKTQFVLGLLLSVQLPNPDGLGKSAIYLSTEAPLNTGRLHQMLATHPYYQSLPENQRPSLDRIHAIATSDLEAQEHIIRYQLPLAVQRFDAGLVVMDSVAANFRAEHETRTARGLSDRAQDLMRLGSMLRRIAIDHNVAVVITNQVSDRFDDVRPSQDRQHFSSSFLSSSPLASRQVLPEGPTPIPDTRFALDHQQKFFTGWGDKIWESFEQPKNPALGFAWANQLSARVVLRMKSVRAKPTFESGAGSSLWSDKKKKRSMNVVFSPWAAPSIHALEYEVQARGLVSVETSEQVDEHSEHSDLLNPGLWYDGAGFDEFP